MKPVFSLLLILVLGVYGCNSVNLSNTEAEKLVNDALGLPNSFREDIKPSSTDFLFEGVKFEKLITNGYMTKSGAWLLGYKGQISEKAKPYYLGEEREIHYFKVYDIVFGEILGILINKEQKSAIIRFSVKAINVTPIGEVLRSDLGAPFLGELSYKKFDTGWMLDSQIQSNSIELLSKIIAERDIISPVPVENKYVSGDIKEKELALNEREKVTEANASTNDEKDVTDKCNGKNQITGKLIGAGNFWCPKVTIFSDEEEKWILLDNFDIKVDNKRLFIWSNSRLENYIQANGDTEFPNEAIESSFLNKKLIFCCEMGPTCGGDEPNDQEEYCIQIVTL